MRLGKAQQFFRVAEQTLEWADDEGEVGDAYVTLCVHAGIAAADAICCQAMGQHAQGESHNEAVALLRRVKPDGKELSNALSALLGMKTKAGYSAEGVNAESRRRAGRASERLMIAARDRLGGAA